uniref:Serpentine receptor class gamma n=1 Tax=Caenorhabditis tropicalis TaxID=1561998 RepID=A0A1I7SXK3_9PELO
NPICPIRLVLTAVLVFTFAISQFIIDPIIQCDVVYKSNRFFNILASLIIISHIVPLFFIQNDWIIELEVIFLVISGGCSIEGLMVLMGMMKIRS